MHSKYLTQIENNFDAQKQVKNRIAELRQAYKSVSPKATKGNIWDEYFSFNNLIYGSKSEIAEKIKSKIKLLRRLRQSNAETIAKLLKENNSKKYEQ
jgi:protein-disulfide isomerase